MSAIDNSAPSTRAIATSNSDFKFWLGFEWLLLAFFPLGVALGTVVAWHREILGGLIALASLAAFHALLLLDGSRPAPGWWFLVFALPALALLVCGVTTRRARPKPAA